MRIQQITIIGTGLIGGSFALAIRKHGFRGRIVGCDRAPVLQMAEAMRAIDDGFIEPVEAAQGSPIVVLATPVGTIISLIEQLGPVLPPDTLLTDVGSTKAEIVARARAVFGSAASERFLGGHPIAGKEHGGMEHANADLFQDAAWLLTPAEGQNMLAGASGAYVELLESIGARILTFSPEQHDRICAWVSHVPQILATALAASLEEEFGRESHGHNAVQDLQAIDGRTLRDMTRIAGSPYSMWRDIALTNGANIEAALSKLEQRLAHLRENLRGPALREEFERANRLAHQLVPRERRSHNGG
jgi:prephenate dehydrogenase